MHEDVGTAREPVGGPGIADVAHDALDPCCVELGVERLEIERSNLVRVGEQTAYEMKPEEAASSGDCPDRHGSTLPQRARGPARYHRRGGSGYAREARGRARDRGTARSRACVRARGPATAVDEEPPRLRRHRLRCRAGRPAALARVL